MLLMMNKYLNIFVIIIQLDGKTRQEGDPGGADGGVAGGQPHQEEGQPARGGVQQEPGQGGGE